MKTMNSAHAGPDEHSSVERWVGFLREYFLSFGLPDVAFAQTAAERVAHAWYATGAINGDCEPMLLNVASQWIEAFARESSESEADWFWRAPSLLSRFPTTFLQTALPDFSRPGDTPNLDLLPESSPCAMQQQEILGPFASAARTMREAWRLIGGPVVD
jgi:hypothetical protein